MNFPPIPCPDCSGMLHLKEKPRSWRGGSGFVYLCENWPECRGLMSAHADGRPCGNPVADLPALTAQMVPHLPMMIMAALTHHAAKSDDRFVLHVTY